MYNFKIWNNFGTKIILFLHIYVKSLKFLLTLHPNNVFGYDYLQKICIKVK